jgi:hypothetical protein
MAGKGENDDIVFAAMGQVFELSNNVLFRRFGVEELNAPITEAVCKKAGKSLRVPACATQASSDMRGLIPVDAHEKSAKAHARKFDPWGPNEKPSISCRLG